VALPNVLPFQRFRRIGQAGLLRAWREIPLSEQSRMILLSGLVGAAAGLLGCAFVATLEWVQLTILQGWAGYTPLGAAGEGMLHESPAVAFRPWLLCLLPASGGLLAGWLCWRFAPEARGGGADGIIRAYHTDAQVRRRVPMVKALAAIACLGTGGSGGREGPIMQITGGLGALLGRALRVGAQQRRVLLVAGMAAGVAAVFRTPLGAALLAVEVLHRDRIESDALVPSLVASVVAYSVFISVFGESILFAHAVRYPFVPSHLPLFFLMACTLAAFGLMFLALFHGVARRFSESTLPEWLKPGLGGLLLGLTTVPILLAIGPLVGGSGRGIGILGGGYGAAQLAITGAPWFASGWLAVELLLGLGVLKMLATALTVGSGGSAGVFGPVLSIGALLGGAFGQASQLLLSDPRIDPGAFALVGMATFWGGMAHCPLAALVLVCELAGSYDLLVPLMLTSAVAFVAMRNVNLYTAQLQV
jgi:chloride channel protein, CIC family